MKIKNVTIPKYSLEEAKRMVQAGWKEVHRHAFQKIFPFVPPESELGKRALEYATTSIFLGELGPLNPHLGFINPERMILVTDEERYKSLPLEKRKQFLPVVTLESRSKRARFLISEEGVPIEFKGLTPMNYDVRKINKNSGQPQGLFEVETAEKEVKGLNFIGEVESEVCKLGEYFGDLQNYAQIYRVGKGGNIFFPWLRMDMRLSVFETLAQLEGVPFETFLYQSFLRFGKQLRRIHSQGVTLHSPFAGPLSRPVINFSSLHNGNVEVHGSILDLEGLISFEEAEKTLQEKIGNSYLLPPRFVYSRAADLHRFLIGNSAFENAVAQVFFKEKKEELLVKALAGIFDGYYQRELEKSSLRTVQTLDINIKVSLSRNFVNTINLLEGIEEMLGFELTD